MITLKSVLNEASTKLFRVYEGDDYGRPSIYMGVFKASSEKEAREKAAKHYKNKEISTTGFYGAEEVSSGKLNKDKAELMKKIEAMTKIIN